MKYQIEVAEWIEIQMNEINLKKILTALENAFIEDVGNYKEKLCKGRVIDLYRSSRNKILKDLCNNKDGIYE